MQHAHRKLLGPPLPPQRLFRSPKCHRHTCTTRHVQPPLASGFTLKREMFRPIIFSTSVHLFYSHPLPSHLKEEIPFLFKVNPSFPSFSISLSLQISDTSPEAPSSPPLPLTLASSKLHQDHPPSLPPTGLRHSVTGERGQGGRQRRGLRRGWDDPRWIPDRLPQVSGWASSPGHLTAPPWIS